MSKLVKLKISDIEKIVGNILSEQPFDDFDTQITPEELPQDPDIDPSEFEDEDTREVPRFLIGKDESGNIAVTDTETGKIIKK